MRTKRSNLSRYTPRAFEAGTDKRTVFASVYVSMMESAAWRDLSANQKVLYLYCKFQYYGEKSHPNGDPLCFTMNRGKWANTYNLYSIANQAGFYRDMEALISHGFIDCFVCGAVTRTKNIYRFSDRWDKYGTTEFSVPDNVKTLAMRRKEYSPEGSC